MTDKEKFEALESYYYLEKFPVWIEYHIYEMIGNLKGEEFDITLEIIWAKGDSEKAKCEEKMRLFQEKRKELFKEEIEKLDRFCEILCTSEKTHKEAEEKVYGLNEDFYSECEKMKKDILKEIEKEKRERRRKKLEKKKAAQRSKKAKEIKKRQNDDFFLENMLPKAECERLLGEGYKRLKISPFGDSGSSYFWVKTRYNESKEHAFFCYLIKAELEKHNIDAVLNVNSGPDVVFEHAGKNYCFDVETGENLKKHPGFVGKKFSRYKKGYDVSFILVTSKKLRYKYSKHGKVVTRSTLRKIISDIAKHDDQ